MGLITLDSWVGQFLLERTCERWDTIQTPTEDILGSRDSTILFDEIHFSGGSTFGLKGLIKLPSEDFDGDNFVRLDMMMRETSLMVYTVERVDASIKTNSKGILEFGRPENGFCWMVGDEGIITYSSLELFTMVQGRNSMIIGLESMDGEMIKYKVNGKTLETLLHKFSHKVDALARANRWAELEVPESSFLQLHRLVEAPFISGHCLISGLEPYRMPKGN